MSNFDPTPIIDDGVAPRQMRGLEIAATRKLVRKAPHVWLVPSTTAVRPTKYQVDTRSEECTCPDFEERHAPCKHIYAVTYVERRSADSAGNVEVTKTMRVTYRQEWHEYNAAQVEEKARFRPMLADLCSLIQQPDRAMGRPRLSLADMVWAAVFKLYIGRSSRRFMTDLAEAQEDGFIARLPHFNSVTGYLGDEALTPILKSLIAASALPLRAVESEFAIDSSGFTTGRFARWYSARWGREIDTHQWKKLHVMVGTLTKIVTAADVTDGFASDSKHFLPLISETVANGMAVSEVSADKAYATKANFAGADELGVTPFIMFKKTTVMPQASLVPGEDSAWARMYFEFAMKREEFLSHYHRRSNVETVFSMMKRKFGEAIRSKGETAQVNEVLAKVLCHNLCVLIHCSHTLGISPKFGDWTPAPPSPTFCAESHLAQEVLVF